MNWKIWQWPARERAMRLARQEIMDDAIRAHGKLAAVRHKLSLARRQLARARTPEEGMSDEQMAKAFEALLDNRGFEALLQLLTEQEMAAADQMAEDGASYAAMKESAGALKALSGFHLRLIELEAQARAAAARKNNQAA